MAGGMAFVLATVVGEKVVEGVSLLLIALAILPCLQTTSLSGQLPWTAWLSIALVLLILGAMVWLAYRQQAIVCRLERLLGRWPRLLDLARSALSGLDVWRRGKVVLALWIWSIAIWGITVLLNQLILWSLDIRVPAVASVVILVVSQIGVRLPSSPGSVGVLHYLSVLALSLFGVDKSVALSYGIILHLVIYLPASLLGLLFLAKSGYSLRRLRQMSEASPERSQPWSASERSESRSASGVGGAEGPSFGAASVLADPPLTEDPVQGTKEGTDPKESGVQPAAALAERTTGEKRPSG